MSIYQEAAVAIYERIKELASWYLQGHQRGYFTVNQIYLPTMMYHQDPITIVSHLSEIPSTTEENIMLAYLVKQRMILKSYFLL